MKNQPLSMNRRRFLRGSGVALALPWLETFAANSPRAEGNPRRFVSIYHPDGVGLPLKADPAWKEWSWFPQGGEKDFQLTKVLDVLEPLRNEITIYSGLSHPASRKVHGHSNADQYLTGAATGGTVLTRTPFPLIRSLLSSLANTPAILPWSCRPMVASAVHVAHRLSPSIVKAALSQR